MEERGVAGVLGTGLDFSPRIELERLTISCKVFRLLFLSV